METKNSGRSKTLQVVMCALFAAIIAVSAQVQVPLPTNVPITLHTFGVALCAAVGGAMAGTVSTAVYVLIGAVGVPVFAGMKGGFAVMCGKKIELKTPAPAAGHASVSPSPDSLYAISAALYSTRF